MREAPAGDGSDSASRDEAVRRELALSHRQLRAFLRRQLGDPQEADDVLQTFAVKALSRSWSLRHVPSVRGWLSRVLATTLLDHHRRDGVRRSREAPENASAAEESIAPDPQVDEAVCDCLHRLLPTLKPQYADVIQRLDIAGEPRERVAADLGTSVNNLGVRLHRARKVLQARLQAMCLTCPEHGYFDCRCEEERRRRALR